MTPPRRKPKPKAMPDWRERDAELTGAPNRHGNHNYMEYLASRGELPTYRHSDLDMYEKMTEAENPPPREKKKR